MASSLLSEIVDRTISILCIKQTIVSDHRGAINQLSKSRMRGENGANGRRHCVWYLVSSACIQYIFKHNNNGKIPEISFMGKREMLNYTGY